MKTDNGQKMVFQGLMKLMAESIEAYSASGRAKGKVKASKEEFTNLLSTVPNKGEICKLEKIEGIANKLNAVFTDLKRNEAELEKLNVVTQEKRKIFDQRRDAAIGDVTTQKGKETARNWGFLVQKSVILGMVNANAFRYVNPREADSLRHIAEAYVQAHNALGMKVVYGVSPRSVQERDADLVKALAIAEAGMDPDKVQELRAAQAELRNYCSYLLKMKVEKSDGMKRSAAMQHKQTLLNTSRVAKSGSRIENVSTTLGETLAPVKPLFTAPRKAPKKA